jgi:hypothetical protein
MDAAERLRENGVRVDMAQIATIAERFSVEEISVFGSSIRNDISDDGNIDLLITSTEKSEISLFDLMELGQQLSDVFRRPVDIVEPAALRNPIRRREILSTKQPLYAA